MSIRKAAALICAVFWATAPTAQTTVDIPFDEARQIAARATLEGNPQLAIDIAMALLQANPNDRDAYLILANALPQVGRAEDGRKAGQRAFALSTSQVQRYGAARQTALAAANEGRFTLSSLWLRRALIHAPNEAETKRTIADAQQVARVNPWSTQLNFSVTPSGNVNGGTQDAQLTFDYLRLTPLDENTVLAEIAEFGGANSVDAQALSGIILRYGITTQYRAYETATSRVQLSFSYDATRVRLSKEARDARAAEFQASVEAADRGEGLPPEPLNGNRDFSSDIAQIGLRYDRIFGASLGTVELTLGQVRYAGDPYYDFGRVSLSYVRTLNDRQRLILSGFAERQDSADGPTADVDRKGARATVVHQFSDGSQLSGTLGLTQSDSDRVNQTSTQWSFQGRYSPRYRLGPAQFSVSAGLSKQEFPAYNVGLIPVLGGREDKVRSLGLDITFPDIQYAGFSPVVSLSAEKSTSNISRFTRDTNNIGLNFVSSF